MSVQASFTKAFLRLYFNYLLRQPYQKQRQIQENFSRRTALILKEAIFEPDEAGRVSVEWVRVSNSRKNCVILYFHGGAYFAGSIVTHRDFAARLAKVTGMDVILADYRLAPEDPFPAAVEDAAVVYHWLLNKRYDPGLIIIAGDSSGGGLALATLVNLRDSSEPLPAGAICLSPWTDLAMTGPSLKINAKMELMCKAESLRQSVRWYVGNNDPKFPLISPLYADLRNLPPLLILVGSEETLLDDSTRLSDRACAVGVEVELKIWPGMFHVFPLVSYMPEARRALEMIGAFTTRRVGE